MSAAPFLSAARGGDVYALRVAADEARDRGDAAAVLALELLAGEFETRVAQARTLRGVLAALANMDRPKRSTVPLPEFLDGLGFSFVKCEATWAERGREGWALVVPTDGTDADATATALTRHIRFAFPKAKLLVASVNEPITAAGRRALDSLTKRHTHERE